MSKFKTVLFTLIGLGISGLATLLTLEIGLRFLPVNSGFYSQAVTPEHPVARFEPNKPFTWSDEWNFAIVNHGRTNNDGFVNDQDYDPDDPRPLAAVIGDSFIQAAMTPYDKTVHGLLAADAAPERRVYSFATAGAPLSQYLIWAQYAQGTYKPDMMIFNVMGNDFEQSLPKYKWFQTFHQFVEDEKGDLTPKLINGFEPSWKGRLVSKSALAQYMLLNLEISQARHKIKERLSQSKKKAEAPQTEYMNNVPAQVSSDVIEDSKSVTDAFFRLLPEYSGLKPSQILFLMEAPRPKIYLVDDMSETGSTYYEQMKVYFKQQAKQKGYEVLDLTQPFFTHYKTTGEKLEYETDGHWNEAGHRIAFEQVLKSKTYNRYTRSLY